MFGEAKRRNAQLLLAAGVPQERIAELTGVSVRTIRRIGREPSAPGLPAADRAAAGQPQRSGPGRPSAVEPFREAVAAMLQEEPRLKSLEVLRQLRERGLRASQAAAHAGRAHDLPFRGCGG